jgi:hypothetical protein
MFGEGSLKNKRVYSTTRDKNITYIFISFL